MLHLQQIESHFVVYAYKLFKNKFYKFIKEMAEFIFQELEKKEKQFCSWCNEFFEPRSNNEIACQECIKEEVEQVDPEEIEANLEQQYAFESLAHEFSLLNC